MIFNGTTTRIPEGLLLAHQEGKVVFFCGAGISRDAGIPLWCKSVSDSARVVGMTLAKKERALLRQGDSGWPTQPGGDGRRLPGILFA